MNIISVDIEGDNKSPSSGSMVCFGACLVEDTSKILNMVLEQE